VGIAIVGAGVISQQYLTMLSACPDTNVIAVADLDVDRAKAVAQRHGVPVGGDVDSVLARPDVELVVNLTIPAAHAQVATAALQAGKHVYGEKPLTLRREDGEKVLAEAASRGLLVGNAPDTFLSAGFQSAKRAISSGAIGTPVAAVTAMQGFGPERWHPGPEFLFQHGGGPLLDMGPYYLTALVALLGPVTQVAGTARTGRAERVIGSGPRAGTRFAVEVPTHVSALIDFVAGSTASSVFSFDSPLPRSQMEITGTEATLSLPNPNTLQGPLRIRRADDEEWQELPVTGTTAGRGVGVVEMARSLRNESPPRASGELALHVLDAMLGIGTSAEQSTFVPLAPAQVEAEPLPEDWDPHASTL
jgi:predicted dehydrogenase